MIKAVLLCLSLVMSSVGFAFSANREIVIHPFVFDKIQYKFDGTQAARAINFQKFGLMVVAFQARTNDETGVPAAFILLGKQTEGKEFRPIQYVSGNEYFNKLEMYDLDGDGIGEVFFWHQGGMHHMDLDVYKIEDSRLKRIFRGGSAEGIETLERPHAFSIKIYRDKFDVPGWSEATPTDRYEIWVWQKDKFVFDKKQSTVKSPQTIERVIKRYVDRYWQQPVH